MLISLNIIIPIIAQTPKNASICSIVISTPLCCNCSIIDGSIVFTSKKAVEVQVYIPSKPAINNKIPAITGLKLLITSLFSDLVTI